MCRSSCIQNVAYVGATTTAPEVILGSNKAGGMRPPGTGTKRSVGAYGSKRGTPDKQNARRRNRMAHGRVRGALDDIAAERDALDKLIAHQEAHPEAGPTLGAEIAARRKERDRLDQEAREAAQLSRTARKIADYRMPEFELEGELKPGWSIGGARQMLRAGYTVTQVQRHTGIGYRWLDDIRLDAEQRGMAD